MKKINYKRLIKVSRLLFLVYLFFALYFLLFAERFGRNILRDEYHYNLTLFKEIKRYISWAGQSELGFKMMLLNIWGNVLCFLPYGFFLPIICEKMRKLLPVAAMTLAFSLAVETVQLVFRIGSFDVDDIMLNTFGGILGYAMFFIIRRFVRKKSGK